jgi:hypothetical protein
MLPPFWLLRCDANDIIARMKRPLVISVLLLIATIGSSNAADLPTVSVEHLYYLRSRAQHLRKLSMDEFIEYCLALKLGGGAFENLYSHISTLRTELAKLRLVDRAPEGDERIKSLNLNIIAHVDSLKEEVRRIQNGLVREGQIASETLDTIARDQR